MVNFGKKTERSLEEAISISGVKSHYDGVRAEFKYLEKKFGKRGKKWQLKRQFLVKKNKRYYDRIELIFSDGTETIIYFDITPFFGRP